ncbi:MAG: hypothetical protein DRP89_04640 [Candidatus Neomarinimicrobiota bacterium]|nr:MAG: hypothetical protein DRP89_04640 [Candidatus Neomarinimicrobiota bacterium]
MRKFRYFVPILTIIIGYLFSCAYLNPTSEEGVIEEGWSLFEQDIYTDALEKFNEAIEINPDNPEGYHGKAWCLLLLNKADSSIVHFITAISKGIESLDPHVGLSAAYLANEDFPLAIERGNYVLEIDSTYYFEHKPQIDYRDIHLILSIAYFHEGQLENAQFHLNYLVPCDRIKPDDPSTWVVNGVTYNSYAEALMVLIDYVDEQYGGI